MKPYFILVNAWGKPGLIINDEDTASIFETSEEAEACATNHPLCQRFGFEILNADDLLQHGGVLEVNEILRKRVRELEAIIEKDEHWTDHHDQLLYERDQKIEDLGRLLWLFSFDEKPSKITTGLIWDENVWTLFINKAEWYDLGIEYMPNIEKAKNPDKVRQAIDKHISYLKEQGGFRESKTGN